MRTLKFTVIGQQLKKDPNCDFSSLVARTSGYLQAQFSFDSEWSGCRKAASFWCLGKEYPVLLKNDVCLIPTEALTWSEFGVQVTGIRKEYKITTNREKVDQRRC